MPSHEKIPLTNKYFVFTENLGHKLVPKIYPLKKQNHIKYVGTSDLSL